MDTDPASAPAPAPAPSSSNRSVRLVIGLLVLLVGIVALLSVLGAVRTEQSIERFSGVTTLELDLENGPVVVVGEGDEVVVDKTVSTGLFGGTSSSEQAGDTVRLIQRCPAFFGFGCRSSYRVTVPVGTRVTGSTSNGPITLERLEGDIDVSTSNGAIQLTEVASAAVVRTSNGAINGSGLLSAEVDVATSNGAVSLDFALAPESVAVQTSNGRVDVLLPLDAPAFAVGTSTSNGQVEIEVRTDPAATPSIDIRTSNGDISLRYSD